mgnify:FL=1
MKRFLSLLLAFLLTVSFMASCGGTADTSKSGDETTQAETPEETEDTRFDGINFGGREFRVLSSEDANDATNAHFLIAGTGEMIGEIVNDAVYRRNMTVEEKLNISLVFTPAYYDYNNASTELRKLVMAGDDAYDLIVNDLRSLAELSAEGLFRNIYNSSWLDLDRSYWYRDYMEDLMIVEGGMYILAGDYLMDILASCHVLYYNKDIIKDVYGDGDTIYKYVFDGNWTIDKFIETIRDTARDIDGDTKMTESDLYGFACIGTWGSAVPVLIGTGIEFVTRDGDSIKFNFNNERSVKILEKMNELFYHEGVTTNITDWSVAGLRNLFGSGNTVFVGYNRLGDLANMRDIEFPIGNVPYPKLDTAQKNYVTSTHDTTEVGAIPNTVTDLEFVTTCLEALGAMTAEILLPEYYENSLKIKYASDATAANMIDLIHDSISSPFACAYNHILNGFMLGTTFCDQLTNRSTDFASAYAQGETAAVARMEELIEKFAGVLAQSSAADAQ